MEEVSKVNFFTTVELTVGERTIYARKIGSGMFTQSFKELASQYVWLFVDENDHTKEIMELVRNRCSNQEVLQHLPEIEQYGFYKMRNHRIIYRELFYEPLRSKHMKAWKQYNLLRDCADEAYHSLINPDSDLSEQGGQQLDLVTEMLREAGETTLAEVVDYINTWATSYGPSYYLDMRTANFKVDRQDNLIFLDPIFDRKLIMKRRYGVKDK